jgi:hypothetical protein
VKKIPIANTSESKETVASKNETPSEKKSKTAVGAEKETTKVSKTSSKDGKT